MTRARNIPRKGCTAARLTPDQVMVIRRAVLRSGQLKCRAAADQRTSIKSLARQFGCTPHTIKAARGGRTYRWVA